MLYYVYLGDLAGWEIWLSPVIQATWEARAVGWLEVDTTPPGKRMDFEVRIKGIFNPKWP
jgi:hypothetical protein